MQATPQIPHYISTAELQWKSKEKEYAWYMICGDILHHLEEPDHEALRFANTKNKQLLALPTTHFAIYKKPFWVETKVQERENYDEFEGVRKRA